MPLEDIFQKNMHVKPRGSNNKRLGWRTMPELIVDTIDNGLYGGVEHCETASKKFKSYLENGVFWRDVIDGSVRHSEAVELLNFRLME